MSATPSVGRDRPISSDREAAERALDESRRSGHRVLGLVVVGAVVIAAAAFWAGGALHGGAGGLPTHVNEPATTVPITYEHLTDEVSGTGTIALPAASPVKVLSPELSEPGAKPVVTAFSWRRGRRLQDGDILVEVAGQPIFVFEGSIPSYRNLTLGDQGADVAQLQRALALAGFTDSDAEGAFGPGTAAAVSALYRDHGYVAPTASVAKPSGTAKQPRTPKASVMLPVWSVVYVHHLPSTVSAAQITLGAQIGEGQTVLDLSVGSPVASIRVDPAAASTIHPGMRVRVTVESTGRTIDGHVRAIHQPQASGSAGQTSETANSGDAGQSGVGTTTSTPGSSEAAPSESESERTVTVGLPPGAGATLGSAVRAEVIRAATPGRVLVVPISAVETAADGRAYVEVGSDEHPRRVFVKEGLEAGGNVAVSAVPGATLRAGEPVVVPD